MRSIVLAIALALLAAPAAQAKKVTIRMATLAPKGSVFHTILGELGQAWKEASNGSVRVKVYAGGVAGDDGDVVRKIRLGTLSGGLLTSAGISTVHKAIHALQIPMALDSYAELDFVLDKLRPELDQVYLDNGFVVLAWVDAGWVRFFSDTAVVSPDDLAAKKLFVWAGQTEATEIWKAAGFNAVPLPSTEISTGLQTGLVNAIPTTPQAALLMQWHKHVGHMTDGRWAPLMGALVVSKKAWDQIDPALHPALLEAGRAAGRKLLAEARPKDAESIAAMRKRGLKVHRVPPAVLEKWRTRVRATHARIRGHYAPERFFDAAMKHRDAFRALGGFTDGADE